MSTTLASVELPADVVNDINLLLGWGAGLVGLICVSKIIYTGGRFAWDKKHNPGIETPTAAEFLGALVGWIIAAAAAIPIATALLAAAHGPQAPAPHETGNLVDEIRNRHPQHTPDEGE